MKGAEFPNSCHSGVLGADQLFYKIAKQLQCTFLEIGKTNWWSCWEYCIMHIEKDAIDGWKNP